jgi:hypothetical protein
MVTRYRPEGRESEYHPVSFPDTVIETLLTAIDAPAG